jgi:hypothetical protein
MGSRRRPESPARCLELEQLNKRSLEVLYNMFGFTLQPANAQNG